MTFLCLQDVSPQVTIIAFTILFQATLFHFWPIRDQAWWSNFSTQIQQLNEKLTVAERCISLGNILPVSLALRSP